MFSVCQTIWSSKIALSSNLILVMVTWIYPSDKTVWDCLLAFALGRDVLLQRFGWVGASCHQDFEGQVPGMQTPWVWRGSCHNSAGLRFLRPEHMEGSILVWPPPCWWWELRRTQVCLSTSGDGMMGVSYCSSIVCQGIFNRRRDFLCVKGKGFTA